MMNEMKTGVYTKGEENYTFKFYTDLPVSKKLKFVKSVVSLVVNDTNYNSVIRDLVFDFYIIDILTDIDTTELKDSLNFLDDVEDFLLSTNIIDIIKANAFPTLFDELNDAVDKSIEYKTGIRHNPLNNALSSLLSTLERKLDSFDMNGAMEMASKFSGMTGELTPESIVNAYMNSDMHKKNLVEIAEAKKNKKNEINIGENLGEAVRTVVKENKADDKTKAKTKK